MKEQILSILLSLFFLSYALLSSSYKEPILVFLDVKQGDSMLIQNGNTQILVDGGGGDYLVQKLGKYMPLFDRKIEILIITHMHYDHFGGIILLLKEYDVQKVVLPEELCKSTYVNDFFYRQLEINNVEIVEEVDLKIGNIKIKTHRPDIQCVSSQSDVNNSSISTEIVTHKVKILNVGDMETEREKNVSFGNFDILKAGHHCSDTSSSEIFLKRTAPIYVICSFGIDNTYGHPSQEVLERMGNLKISILTTAENGDIVVNLISSLIYNGKGKIIGKIRNE